MTTPAVTAARAAVAGTESQPIPAAARAAGVRAPKKKTTGAQGGGAGPRARGSRPPAPARRAAAPGRPAPGARGTAPAAPTSRRRAATPRKKAKPLLTGRDFAPQLGKGGNASKVLVAEFVACVVLIGLTPILMRKPSNGKLYTPNDFVRLSAVCLLFFVLALSSASARAGRIAAAFGGLVVLGTLFNAAGSLQAIVRIFAGAQKSGGTVPTAAAGTATITAPSYTPVNLAGNPLEQAGGPAAPAPGPTATAAAT